MTHHAPSRVIFRDGYPNDPTYDSQSLEVLVTTYRLIHAFSSALC